MLMHGVSCGSVLPGNVVDEMELKHTRNIFPESLCFAFMERLRWMPNFKHDSCKTGQSNHIGISLKLRAFSKWSK